MNTAAWLSTLDSGAALRFCVFAVQVSPWEIEVDPEEEKRREEDRRREEEVMARAARVAAKQQRAEYLSQLGGMSDSGSGHDPDFDPEGEVAGGRARRSRGNWVPSWQVGQAMGRGKPSGQRLLLCQWMWSDAAGMEQGGDFSFRQGFQTGISFGGWGI